MLLFLSFIACFFVFYVGCVHHYWENAPKNEFKKTGNISLLLGIFTTTLLGFPFYIIENFVYSCIYKVKDYITQVNHLVIEKYGFYTGLPNNFGLYYNGAHLQKVFMQMPRKTIAEMAAYADVRMIWDLPINFKENNFRFLDGLQKIMLEQPQNWHYVLNATAIGNIAYMHEYLQERTEIFKDNYQTLQPTIDLCRDIIEDFREITSLQLKQIQNKQLELLAETPIFSENSLFHNVINHPSSPNV